MKHILVVCLCVAALAVVSATAIDTQRRLASRSRLGVRQGGDSKRPTLSPPSQTSAPTTATKATTPTTTSTGGSSSRPVVRLPTSFSSDPMVDNLAGKTTKDYSKADVLLALKLLEKQGFAVGLGMPTSDVDKNGHVERGPPLSTCFFWKIVESEAMAIKRHGITDTVLSAPVPKTSSSVRGPVICCKGYGERSKRNIIVHKMNDKQWRPFYASSGQNSDPSLRGTYEPFQGIVFNPASRGTWFFKNAAAHQGAKFLLENKSLGDELKKLKGDDAISVSSLAMLLVRFEHDEETARKNMEVSARIGSPFWSSARGQAVIKALKLDVSSPTKLPAIPEDKATTDEYLKTEGEINEFIGTDNMFEINLAAFYAEHCTTDKRCVPGVPHMITMIRKGVNIC